MSVSSSKNVDLIPLAIRLLCALLKWHHERGDFCGVDKIYYAACFELENELFWELQIWLLSDFDLLCAELVSLLPRVMEYVRYHLLVHLMFWVKQRSVLVRSEYSSRRVNDDVSQSYIVEILLHAVSTFFFWCHIACFWNSCHPGAGWRRKGWGQLETRQLMEQHLKEVQEVLV